MSQVKELLVEELQDLLSAENQLLKALPQMAQAARNPKLKEAFEKHLQQTQMQVERLNQAFEMLGEDPEEKSCRGMAGIIQEGQEKIQESDSKEEVASDLSLICAAQKAEHYEISGYGTARTLALQLQEKEVARLLGHTLGEEESTDYLLTEISKPIIQQASMDDHTGGKKEPRKGGQTMAGHKRG